MLLGYIWVASDDESLGDQQRQALIEAGVNEEKLYEDLGLSRQEPRPGLQTCLRNLTPGDTLVVWKIGVLVDSRAKLLNALRDLSERGTGIRVLSGKGTALSTSEISLQKAIAVLSVLAELESEAILEGQATARAKGVQLGGQRKVTPEMIRFAMEAMTNSDASVSSIAQELGITRATLYNYLNGDGSPKPSALQLLQSDQ